MKKISVLLFLVSFAYAGKGSIYSRYGVGELNLFMSGKNAGMGNTGLALFGDSHINLLNPASSAFIPRTLLSATYQYRNYVSEDNSGSSLFGTGNISSAALAFPVYDRNKMVLTLGLLPYSSVAYEQQISSTVAGSSLVQSFDGRGGINSGQIGISYAAATDIYVGVTAHYLFGSIYRDQTITFLSGSNFGGSFHQSNSVSGIGFTFGGIYTGIDKALGYSDTKQMNLGVTIFTGSSLSFDEQLLRDFATNQDTLTQAKSITLPFGFAAGLSYTKDRTNYAADFHFQNWGSFSLPGVSTSFQNSFRIGAGVEFLPASDFINDEFLKRLSYRFGAYVHRTNLVLNGESINELFISSGLSFPMSMETRVHCSLEYGIRGTTSSSLIKDSVIRFTVAVSASELMFIQPPID
ncbi:MAG: hypothetical protein WCW35_10760 [Bacteroidota bacterium]